MNANYQRYLDRGTNLRIDELKTKSQKSDRVSKLDALLPISICTRVIVVCILIAGAVGCDDRPKRVAVSGSVLIDGEPLTVGNIRFVPTGQRPSAGTLDENGRFTLTCFDGNDGTVLGTHRVQISASEIINGNKVKWHAPNKYSDFRTSGISVEITEPIDDLVIELTWDGEKKPGRKK